MWPQLQTVAEIAIARILNSLPEGLLIALFGWAMLRLLPRQNSGTRFAVWFVALLGVAGLPFIGDVRTGYSLLPAGTARPVLTLPGHVGVLVFLGWLLVTCAAMARLAIGLWHLLELRRNCVAVDAAELHPTVRKTVAELGSSRSVTLATSERVNVPAAIGFFKPVIVIPAWALRELPSDKLNIILLHEFAHLRRWDDWTNLLQKMVRAAFFFHPAVWWIESRLSLEREMACDDQVLAATADARGYAECLIALLEKSLARRGWAMAQAAVHRAQEASLRLAQILDTGRPNSKHVWKPALGLVGVFSLVCLAVMPGAPKFVAFEGNGHEIPAGDVHAALDQYEFFPAAVIPVRTSASTAPAFEKMAHPLAQQVVKKHVERRSDQRIETPLARVEVAEAIGSARSMSSAAEVVEASTSEPVVPAVETIFVVRTTQRIGPNSWVWRVSVWRVSWVNPAQEKAARLPAANKT